MKKKELIERLKMFSRKSLDWKGQYAFVSFLVYYLENLDIPKDDKYDFWQIDPYIPQLMFDAFEQLRLGTDEQTAKFRRSYELEVGHKVPNITDIGASNILDQSNAVQTTLGFMLREVMGDENIRYRIDAYCNAQKHVLMQFFDKFLRSVYRHGMYEIIHGCGKRGMSGRFDGVELRIFVTAGRIMFTFGKRINKNRDGHYMKRGKLYRNEWNISFIGEYDDPLCLSAGIQSVNADFRTALDMIEEVVKNWPKEITKQKKILKPDDNVSFG